MNKHYKGRLQRGIHEKRIWKKAEAWLTGLLVLVTLLAGCGGPSQGNSFTAGGTAASASPAAENKPDAATAGGDTSGKADLTLMIYLCGSDLESKAGAASADLDEILGSGINTDKVNVVVTAGGTTKWQNGFSDDETAVYTLTPDLQWEKTETFSSPEQDDAPANMGETETLKSFLDYSYENYSAQNYALIMWDHGGGPMRGLCWDTAWAKDNLTMEEFTGALAESPYAKEKLSWIGFDACLMSSIETAHLAAPYAEYMIASEETEPAVGWSYDFLNGIENDADGAATGKRIVDSFMAAGKASGSEAALTLACMDLSQTQAVEEKLDSFFSKLGSYLSKDSFSELSNLREDTREFGKAMNDSQRLDLVDLGDLVAHYAGEAPEEAADLSDALQKMVVYSQSSLENCSGLSSYHPYYNKTYYEKVWRKEYDTFAFAPAYTDYINSFADIWMGDAMGDWTQMSQVQSAGIEGETQYFSVQLTPEQIRYYASGQLLVLSQVGSDYDAMHGSAYSQVFATDEVTVDENGVLTAGYNGRTLYAVDDNGQPIAGPLHYSVSKDGNLQVYANYVNDGEGEENRMAHVMFECAQAPAGTDLPVLDQYVYDEDTDIYTNRLALVQGDYQTVNFPYDYRMRTYDGDTIKPFVEWEQHSTRFGIRKLELPADFHFRFFDRILDNNTLFACFQISDTQANLYGTELMPVDNPSVSEIHFRDGQSEDGDGNDTDGGEKFVYENDDWRMTVWGEAADSELSKELELKVYFENLSDRELHYKLPNGAVTVNGTQICQLKEGGILGSVVSGSSSYDTITFGPDDLAGLTEIHEISMDIECTEQSDERGADERDVSAQVVLHPVDLNLEKIAAKYDLSSPLSSCSKGNIDWSIVAIKPDGNWNYKIVVHCKNTSAETVQLPDIKRAAINGAVVDFQNISRNLVLQPGVECYLSFKMEKRSYYWHFFGSNLNDLVASDADQYGIIGRNTRSYSNGSFGDVDVHHLIVSDIFKYFQIEEISSLSLLPDDNLWGWDLPEEDWNESIVDFSFSKPVTPAQPNEPYRGLKQDLSEEDGDDGEMTKALDAGGTQPERTLLYSQGGVRVYGEHILIRNRRIVMSVVIENESDDDVILRFYNYTVKSGDDSAFNCFGQDAFVIFASNRRRIFRDFRCPDEMESDVLKSFSMCIWQDGKELPSVYEVNLTFADGISLSTVGGITMPFSDGAPAVVCVTQDHSSDPLFASSLKYPDKAEQFMRELTWTLPDSLTEEERKRVKSVEACIMWDRTDVVRKLEEEKEAEQEIAEQETAGQDAENQETADQDAEDQETADQEAEDRIGLMPVSLTTLHGDSDPEGRKDVYTGSLMGLACIPEKHPDVIIPMYEDITEESEITYGTNREWDGKDYCFSPSFDEYFVPLPQLNIYRGPEFNLSVKVKSKTGAESEASLDSFIKYDQHFSSFRNDPSSNGYQEKWPTAWFEGAVFTNTPRVFVRDEEDVLYLSASSSYTVHAAEAELKIENGPLAVEMIPVTELEGDIVLVYIITFEDDYPRFYYGGTW